MQLGVFDMKNISKSAEEKLKNENADAEEKDVYKKMLEQIRNNTGKKTKKERKEEIAKYILE